MVNFETSIQSPLVIGEFVEVVTTRRSAKTGRTLSEVRSGGTYLGVQPSQWTGEPMHMFKGGFIGDTPQGADGLHGFPVDRVAQ